MSSDPHSSAHLDPEPSDRDALLSAIGWLGAIFLFAVIVAIAWLPNQAADAEQKASEERIRIRNETLARQIRLANSYDWVDQSKGIVRIPIERAMQITVEEMRHRQIQQPSID
jgi:hypothetical protein